ncbi:hypothetical protein ACTFIW_008728 [Dictyostelium discoideum]
MDQSGLLSPKKRSVEHFKLKHPYTIHVGNEIGEGFKILNSDVLSMEPRINNTTLQWYHQLAHDKLYSCIAMKGIHVDKTAVRSFMVTVKYCKDFIQNLTTIADPLYLAQSAIVLAVNAQASLSRVRRNKIAKEIYGSEVLLSIRSMMQQICLMKLKLNVPIPRNQLTQEVKNTTGNSSNSKSSGSNDRSPSKVVKTAVANAVSLNLPDINYPFYMECDSSNIGIGSVLYQLINNQKKVLRWCHDNKASSRIQSDYPNRFTKTLNSL